MTVDDGDGVKKLRDLNVRMIRLHKVLLDRQHEAYERDYGPVMPARLLQLVLTSEQFAWLRPLSDLMARIDEAVDDSETSRTTVEGLFREVHGLLRSNRQGAFETRYRDALQESPDVVIAHADVVRALPRRDQ
jgi:hypothetical protein